MKKDSGDCWQMGCTVSQQQGIKLAAVDYL